VIIGKAARSEDESEYSNSEYDDIFTKRISKITS